MHRLIAQTAASIRRAWISLVLHLRDENPDPSPYTDLRGLDTGIASFAAAERLAYLHAGAATATAASPSAVIRKKILYFDDADPSVMSWAERNRLDLIRQITFEQRAMIRYALSVAQETGENPRVTAQRILDDIGLTDKQAAAVESYREALTSGQYAAALRRELSDGRSDRVIRAAAEADRPLTDAQIESAVSRYRTNMLRLRAETIARTEAQRITHQASDDAYGQAVRRGDLNADQLEGEWIATRDPRTRDSHAAMHGQRQPWGEPFISGAGNELRFPGDPEADGKETINCRCTRVVHLRPSATLRNAA